MKLRVIPKYICLFIYICLWTFALGIASNIGFARTIGEIIFDVFLFICLMYCVINMHIFLESHS